MQMQLTMSASAPLAQSIKPLPLHSLCYLGISPMAPDRRSWSITLPIKVESTCWCVIYSASTPSSTRSQPSLSSHCVCACMNSSHTMVQYPCSIQTMVHHLLPVTLYSSCNTITLTISLPQPISQSIMASQSIKSAPLRPHTAPPKTPGRL